jgi:polyisoprenoid-binding protein YceI
MESAIAVNRYVIDKRTSRFTVRAFASGALSVFGHNPVIAIRDLSGEVGFDPESPQQGFLRLRINAKSMEVSGDISGKDRREMERMMFADVLEVDRYPEIVYQGSAVAATRVMEGRYRADIAGDLTLHGVVRKELVSAQVISLGETLRASGEFSLRQTDYSIKLVSVAGGTLKLRDELKFSFDIVARKQE